MLKEFKEFAMKGNMLDMAVGIIIGAAFGTVITSLVADILTPLISGVFGVPDFKDMYAVLKEAVTAPADASLTAFREAGGVAIAYGNFINQVIAFLLVALALFFVVKGMNNLKKKEEAAAPEAPAGPTAEETLLAEIRDAIKAQN
ncbi:MAG: large-conductance mechanosensitive channel protein MscL [Bacteroidia bacterium]